MRGVVLVRLLASTSLAVVSGLPVSSSFAQSNSVRALPPLPPSLQEPARHVVVPIPQDTTSAARVPQPRARVQTTIDERARAEVRDDDPPPRRELGAVPVPREAPAPQPEAVAAPAPAAVPAPAPVQNSDRGVLDIKGTIEKLFAASDIQITEKIRELATTKQLDRKLPRAAERTAVEQIYASRNYAPLWIKDGTLTPRAKSAVARLSNAAADGLDAADYAVPNFAAMSNIESLAAGDVALTYSLVNFARNLQIGRIAPRRVLVEVDYGDHTPDPTDLAKKIAASRDIDAILDSFNPPQDGFRALKDKLAALREKVRAGERLDAIASGPALKVGSKDARVPALRQKLGVNGKTNDTVYDKKLAYAVKLEQQRHGLPPTGALDGATIAAINGPSLQEQVNIVEANMERWRWLPRDLGKVYVMVNIPDYSLKVVRGNEIVWRTKIVAGKPQTMTPLTSGSMHSVIVNPSWYVPASIIQNELLPQYASDPQIFERLGLEVKRGPDGHINVVQPPGAANALGRIKFAFNNKFAVYLHDTPERRLFTAERRAFSHGCMRVEDPTKFGEVMLSLAMTGPTPNSQQINSMIGHEEKDFKLVNRPVVHLTYQTAFVDESGSLQLRDDIYNFDQRIQKILTTSERKIADVAPPPESKQREVATNQNNQDLLRRVERREASNPFVFFERLFR